MAQRSRWPAGCTMATAMAMTSESPSAMLAGRGRERREMQFKRDSHRWENSASPPLISSDLAPNLYVKCCSWFDGWMYGD
jgi:hypothetical protein